MAYRGPAVEKVLANSSSGLYLPTGGKDVAERGGCTIHVTVRPASEQLQAMRTFQAMAARAYVEAGRYAAEPVPCVVAVRV